jgi:hypothetical protein
MAMQGFAIRKALSESRELAFRLRSGQLAVGIDDRHTSRIISAVF